MSLLVACCHNEDPYRNKREVMIVFGFLPSSDLLQVDLISRTKKVLRSERSEREKASKASFNEVTQRPSERRRKKH